VIGLLVVFLATSAVSELRAATLIGWWSFDEGGGDVAIDGSTLHNDGIIYGAASIPDGVRGRALRFDGATSFVQIPHTAAYDDTSAVTVEAWIRMDPVQSWDYPCVFDKSHRAWDEPPFCTGYTLQDPGDRSLAFFACGEPSCSGAAAGEPLNDGDWHFVVGTVSTADSIIRFYLDGMLAGEADYEQPLGVNGGDLFIGRHYLLGRYYTGDIDEVQVYSGALSAEEIAADYREVIGPDLVGWWSFDEPNGDVAVDSSIYANAGVIVGAARVPGVVGSAAAFDGVETFVQIPAAAQYDLIEEISVEAWVRMDPVQDWDQPCIFDKSHRSFDDPPTYTGYTLQDNGDRTIAFVACGPSGCLQASSTTTLNDDVWHFLIGTTSVADGLTRFYVDGELVEEELYAAPAGVNAGDVFIGCHYRLGRYYKGLVDEVKVYRGALTSSQARSHYEAAQIALSIESVAARHGLVLHGNVPNPFNPTTTFKYDVPQDGRVTLRIYDVRGALVRTLVDTDLPHGSHLATWDGRDASGRGMASGSYFARLEAGGKVETVRMSLVR
jgi:hypothetical protein